MNEFLPTIGSIFTGLDNNTTEQDNEDGINFLFELENALERDFDSPQDDQHDVLTALDLTTFQWRNAVDIATPTGQESLDQQRNIFADSGNIFPLNRQMVASDAWVQREADAVVLEEKSMPNAAEYTVPVEQDSAIIPVEQEHRAEMADNVKLESTEHAIPLSISEDDVVQIAKWADIELQQDDSVNVEYMSVSKQAATDWQMPYSVMENEPHESNDSPIMARASNTMMQGEQASVLSTEPAIDVVKKQTVDAISTSNTFEDTKHHLDTEQHLEQESAMPPALKVSSQEARMSANMEPVTVQVSTPLHDTQWPEDMGQRIQWFHQNNISSANIAIEPAELGPIQIKIDWQDGTLDVTLVSQHSQVRALMEQHVPQLQEQLREHHVSPGQIHVTDNTSQFHEHRQRQAQQSMSQPGHVQSKTNHTQPTEDTRIKANNLVDYYV